MKKRSIGWLVSTFCVTQLLAASSSADVYEERRESVRSRLDSGVAIIWGSRSSSEDYGDQRSDFFYLTGLDEPNAALVLLPGGKRIRSRGKILHEILYLPERNREEERWTGEKLGPGEESEEKTGIERIDDISRLNRHIERFLRGEKILHVSAERSGIDDPLTKDQLWVNSLREHNLFVIIEDLSPILASMRRKKEPFEIDQIRTAIDITRRALLETIKMVSPGLFEYQVESTVLYFFRYQGADGPAFTPIVGSGPNSTVLHYSANNRRMEEGDLLVLDVGAEYRHYAADITRTLPVSGSFTVEQAEIYDIVLEAQRRAIEQVKPGALYRDDIEGAARDYIEEKGFGDYFFHGTGHFVGLDVHDVGDYEIPLEPGVILTIEPGIYIPDKGIGVRIEDMVLVTENGHEILSHGIPKSRREIEEAMRAPTSTLPSSQP